jgi:thiocyanate hydrolase subunit beta
MSSSTREEVLRHLQTVGHLQPALHKQTHAPAPTEITHTLYRAYTRAVHDVGGEYDVPIEFHEKEEEVWELNTFATCECLAWRGVWTAEERRRRQNVDVGQTVYLGLPYYGRWLMTAALILIDKQYVTLTELHDKIEEVRKRYEQSSAR